MQILPEFLENFVYEFHVSHLITLKLSFDTVPHFVLVHMFTYGMHVVTSLLVNIIIFITQ